MIAKFREKKDLYARCDYLKVAKLPAFETSNVGAFDCFYSSKVDLRCIGDSACAS